MGRGSEKPDGPLEPERKRMAPARPVRSSSWPHGRPQGRGLKRPRWMHESTSNLLFAVPSPPKKLMALEPGSADSAPLALHGDKTQPRTVGWQASPTCPLFPPPVHPSPPSPPFPPRPRPLLSHRVRTPTTQQPSATCFTPTHVVSAPSVQPSRGDSQFPRASPRRAIG